MDKLVDLLIDNYKKVQDKEKELADRPRTLAGFTVEKGVGSLVQPCRLKGEHHRGREKHWTTELEKAERDLREKGINVEVYDPTKGYCIPVQTAGWIASGSIGTGPIGSGSIGSWMTGNTGGALVAPPQGPTYQTRMDEKFLSAVKHAKDKMLHHRGLADRYARWARAFSVADPGTRVVLTLDDIEFFALEAE